MPSRRVLLVEDEPGLVMTLTDRLVAEGHEVESEGDAVAEFARATAGPFDAILLDVMLPGGNGFECAAPCASEESIRRSSCSPPAGRSWTRSSA